MRSNVITIVFIILTMITPAGCINENCFPEKSKQRLTIHLRYIKNDFPDLFENELKQVTLYIFSPENNYLQSLPLNWQSPENQREYTIEIPPGNYNMIGWGNLSEHTTVSPQNPAPGNQLSDFKFTLSMSRGDDIYYPTSDSLFHARQNISVPASDGSEYNLFFRREACYIQIVMEGFSLTPEIKLRGMQGGYDMKANILPEQVQYAPNILYNLQTSAYEANFAILRPANTNQLKLELYQKDHSTLLYTLDLSKILKELGINTEKDDEINLLIRLKPLEGNRLSISVNNWHIIENIHIDM